MKKKIFSSRLDHQSISIQQENHLPQGTPDFELQEANPRELHLSPEPKGITTSKLPAVIKDDDTSVVVDVEI